MTDFVRQTVGNGAAVAAAIPVEVPRRTWYWRAILSGYRPKGVAGDIGVVKALRELSTMTDQELSDIGLGRSDLTSDGLHDAAKRRARLQVILR